MGVDPSTPKLFSITFENDPKMIEEIVLKTPFEAPSKGVSYLKRIKDKQVLVAGCMSSVHVVEWTGTMFSLLNTVPNIHTSNRFLPDLITGIDVDNENRIYTACAKDNHFVEITFIE